MSTEKITRKFKFGTKTLTDPDTTLSPKEVVKYYSMTYPELTSGSVKYTGLKGEGDDEHMEYELSSSIGTKG